MLALRSVFVSEREKRHKRRVRVRDSPRLRLVVLDVNVLQLLYERAGGARDGECLPPLVVFREG